jgi:hypothetical protein
MVLRLAASLRVFAALGRGDKMSDDDTVRVGTYGREIQNTHSGGYYSGASSADLPYGSEAWRGALSRETANWKPFSTSSQPSTSSSMPYSGGANVGCNPKLVIGAVVVVAAVVIFGGLRDTNNAAPQASAVPASAVASNTYEGVYVGRRHGKLIEILYDRRCPTTFSRHGQLLHYYPYRAGQLTQPDCSRRRHKDHHVPH